MALFTVKTSKKVETSMRLEESQPQKCLTGTRISIKVQQMTW